MDNIYFAMTRKSTLCTQKRVKFPFSFILSVKIEQNIFLKILKIHVHQYVIAEYAHIIRLPSKLTNLLISSGLALV